MVANFLQLKQFFSTTIRVPQLHSTMIHGIYTDAIFGYINKVRNHNTLKYGTRKNDNNKTREGEIE